jgi:hypothetical protein
MLRSPSRNPIPWAVCCLVAVGRSWSGVCWVSELHTDAVHGGINIAFHVVLFSSVPSDDRQELGMAPLQWQVAGRTCCLGFHHSGAGENCIAIQRVMMGNLDHGSACPLR